MPKSYYRGMRDEYLAEIDEIIPEGPWCKEFTEEERIAVGRLLGLTEEEVL